MDLGRVVDWLVKVRSYLSVIASCHSYNFAFGGLFVDSELRLGLRDTHQPHSLLWPNLSNQDHHTHHRTFQSSLLDQLVAPYPALFPYLTCNSLPHRDGHPEVVLLLVPALYRPTSHNQGYHLSAPYAIFCRLGLQNLNLLLVYPVVLEMAQKALSPTLVPYVGR